MARGLKELRLDRILAEDPGSALERLRRTPSARPVLEDLYRFLDRFGHRCAGEGEVMTLRWAESPGQVLELVAAYLKGGADPIETRRGQAELREKVTADARARLGIVRRALFGLLMARTQRLTRLRENGKHWLSLAFLPSIAIHRELARRWTERGWLRGPEDLYFLTGLEIEAIIDAGDPAAMGQDIASLADGRRRAWRRWFTVDPPEAIDSGGLPLRLETGDAERGLKGLPACGGRVRGTARVIMRAADAARLSKGEILVARAADPGWTPVFPLVGGLVLEIGGQLSHGAIVAREYGVPAVVNVRNATKLIRDGSTITVDGWTGLVLEAE
jgi:pyruvate,water dikinase